MGFPEKKIGLHAAAHGVRGNVLLGMILLVAASAVAVGSATAVYTKVLDDELTDETWVELELLAGALVDYWDDTGGLPASIADLTTKPGGATGWFGPYLRGNFSDLDNAALLVTTDAWGNTYNFASPEAFEIQVWSNGPNGVDDDGDGDDISMLADADKIAWADTNWELRILRAAITAYNFYTSNPEQLPLTWLEAVEAMQNNGYLPAGAATTQRFLTDGWGQTYVPDGAPITAVNSDGPPEEEEN